MFHPILHTFRIAVYRQTLVSARSQFSFLAASSRTDFPSWIRRFSTKPANSFEEAKEKLSTLSEDPGPAVKLQLYGLFKQATTGQCNAPKPGMLDMVAKAKWTAWNSLGSMSKEEAQNKYLETVNELLKADTAQSPADSVSGGTGNYKEITCEEIDKITYIKMNRPNKMNAITKTMYEELTEALHAAGKSKTSMATVLTGAGKYYSSGNDLSNLAKLDPNTSIEKLAKDAAVMLDKFVSAFIDHPKLLVAMVNGPCIGIACTTLGLCDVIYASDSATFHTPFTTLGLTPEGCSSYMFPKMMGPLKANEMLLLGRKLTAADACKAGLVTDVFPADTFEKEVRGRLQQVPKLMPKSLKESKIFIRSIEQEQLHKVNKKECHRLIDMWQGEECLSAAAKFLSKS